MPPWEIPLQTVCACLSGRQGESAIPFLIVGSVASELQGCTMGTRDLDVLFSSEDDLKQYTARVSRHLDQPESAIICQSFGAGFKWYKAQHEIAGFPVDVLYVSPGVTPHSLHILACHVPAGAASGPGCMVSLEMCAGLMSTTPRSL